jgi:hypothetical protein
MNAFGTGVQNAEIKENGFARILQIFTRTTTLGRERVYASLAVMGCGRSARDIASGF